MLSIFTTLALVAAPQAVDPVGSLQRLDVPLNPIGTVAIALDINDVPVTLVMERHSVRSADFKLWVTRPDGRPVEVPAPAPTTWRGTVQGMPNAHVVASITDLGLTATVIDEAADSEWQIQPAIGFPQGTYSIATADDIVVPIGICGTPNGTVSPPVGPQASGDGTGLQLCEIALDADFEFYQRNGSSATATLNDMERVLNGVDVIYIRDCDVTFQITGVVIRTTIVDPYTSSNAQILLDEFRNQWNAAFVGVRRDIAHLFTGKNMQNGTIGIARLSAICNLPVAYGLSESRFTSNIIPRVGLTAHELGHNFSANHCNGNGNCRIMCDVLLQCNNDVTRFGTQSAGIIRNYAIGRPCLLNLAPPQTVPLLDQFNTAVIDTDLWISNQGAIVTTSAVGEPSGTQSLQLNALNSGLERDDRLISNKLLLNGQTNLEVQFFAEARGVPAGGALNIEVLDQFDNWQSVIRLVSNGATQSSFTAYAVPLPVGGYHNEAQIRIFTEVDGSAESWYIDDFAITDVTSCNVNSVFCVNSPNSVSLVGATLTHTGSTSITANDLSLFGNGIPSGQFGLLIYGESMQFSLLGDGFLCVDGAQIFRNGIGQAGIFGIMPLPLDQNALPGGSVINPGDTLNFQVWYRDTGGAGFNLSTGLSLTFCP